MKQIKSKVNSLDEKVPNYVFSGYVRQANDTWADVYEGNAMPEFQWEEDQPDNNDGLGGENCVAFHRETETTKDTICSGPLFPTCQVQERHVFFLQGICKTSYIDRFYVMESAKNLLGFMQNRMVWSEQNRRWEIENLITNSTAAYMHKTGSYHFPLGTHDWLFENEDCPLSNLNFHLAVP